MIEVIGDLWEYPADWRIITTNGYIKRDGTCVMGRGCAYQAALRYPELPYKLGLRIKSSGNRLWIFDEYKLITFPVKDYFYNDARLDIIQISVEELLFTELLDNKNIKIVMPRAGCGNGNLKWEEVKPILSHLPDNVFVINKK